MSGLGVWNYLIIVFLMMTGLYMVISSSNLVKKLIGLNVFQTSVFFMYISFGYVTGGDGPLFNETTELYSNPLPHVLILTAIVVGVATTAVGLALSIRIKESFGTIEEDDLHKMDSSL
ncbi:Na+/H+ antiporter subunit C [Pseudohongiella acticola]|jgi:multicomponent Na+:H+ antiporter subunit C|uniref:Na+/H+ antiporter subunit C n=1 Tax=Pseudohongiella acticola TaxID=1524254 RepID=A0A1E8CHD1_9GAMM|nr:cation:proton antiporter subunit C [Pseudohongiella acticola]OFE11834.1 Na+/H+ antiporter subunit C [Pseudohongiella acticola]